MQGWDNYKKEFRQLRRSFRTDEYNTISDLNPPTGFFGKVLPLAWHLASWSLQKIPQDFPSE